MNTELYLRVRQSFLWPNCSTRLSMLLVFICIILEIRTIVFSRSLWCRRTSNVSLLEEEHNNIRSLKEAIALHCVARLC